MSAKKRLAEIQMEMCMLYKKIDELEIEYDMLRNMPKATKKAKTLKVKIKRRTK